MSRKASGEKSGKTGGGAWSRGIASAPGAPISRNRMQVRVILLAALVIIFFLVLAARLWQLQVLSGEDYSLSARQTYTRQVRIPAQRGVIHDRNGKVLADNVAGLNVTVVPEEIGRDKLRKLSGILGANEKQVLKRYNEAKGVGNSYSPILVRENAASEDVTYVSERTGEFPGVSVQDEYVRNYPLGTIAAHVLGYTGAVSREELKASGGKLANDAIVGKSGIELVYEKLLRGEPGQRTYSVDAQGRIVDGKQHAAGDQERQRIEAQSATKEPVPGKDLRLSLDLGLQSTVEEELARAVESSRKQGYDSTGGASVVLDPKTGEILAMASYPSFDPQLFVGGVSGAGEVARYNALVSADANSPFTNRAVSGAHPAGSTFKAFTGLAGLAYHVITSRTTFTDDGSCWRPKGANTGCWQSWREFDDTGTVHGTQNLAEAIADSNDKFFYQVADWLWHSTSDQNLLPKYYQRFGFGQRTGVDLPGEAAGRVPTKQWHQENGSTADDRYWGVGRWVNMAIGQGDVLVTPVQLATAYAALENGGTLVQPHLALDARSQDGRVVKDFSKRFSGGRKVDVTDQQLSEVMNGLRGVTKPGGTAASIFKDSSLDVVGKTGTAQRGDGEKNSIGWFAGWAENQKKPVVVVTMVEGGGGHEVAAPSVLRVLERYHSSADAAGGTGNGGG